MGRYKKKLRAEKAKVKLKKKNLPKGQNVTDTSFKVKKIVTVEQLKKVGEGEPVSSWNVPLKDLLTHLGHHNKSSRLNALNGIKEIITKYPGVLKGPMLKNTVMKVLEMMGDVESKIRVTVVNLLDTLFGMLSSQEMSGFHELLNLHLTCAMTHRHPAVQKDSLKLADVVIKHAPEAIKQNIKVIMVNFIRLLSSYKYGARSEIFLVRGSKKDLEENRIAIFQRLRSVLKICYLEKENVDNVVSCDWKYFSKKIFVAHFKRLPDLSGIFKNQGLLFKKASSEDNEKDFKMVVTQIMPLIFETWSEFCPNRSSSHFIEECVLKESTAKLLSLMLETIMILYESSLKFETQELKNLISMNYGNQIVKLFLFNFPYVPQVMGEKSDLMLEESVSAYTKSYESQNLTLCYLSYHMKLGMSNNLKKLLDDYVIATSQIRNTRCDEILSKIFEFMILSPRRQKRSDMFMKMSYKCYKRTTNARFQSKLLQMLSKVITEEVKYAHVVENEYLHEWISYLAKGLWKNRIHFETLEILSKAIQRKIGLKTLGEIENQFMDIVKNLPDIKIEGCDELDGKKCIGNILYWCDNKIIEAVLENGILEGDRYSSDIKTYLINIFSFKINVGKVVTKRGEGIEIRRKTLGRDYAEQDIPEEYIREAMPVVEDNEYQLQFSITAMLKMNVHGLKYHQLRAIAREMQTFFPDHFERLTYFKLFP